MIPIALTIAGSDPSGGAGLQADLKTFHQRKVYGMSVVTLLTVQNTKGIKDIVVVDPVKVAAQLDTLLEDLMPQAAKTGALGNQKVVALLAERARYFQFPLVVDPVMRSKDKTPLLSDKAQVVLKEKLLPFTTLLTPNLHEAGVLAEMPVNDLESMEKAAAKISDLGVKAVLVKGGHLEGEAADLFFMGGKVEVFRSPRIETKHTHGVGCTYAAAITAELAKGSDLITAVRTAKHFITQAIQTAPGPGQGSGHCGPSSQR